MRSPRIGIVGAGNVGAAAAAAIGARGLPDVHLYDVVADVAVGKAMDINQASCFFQTDSRVVACASLAGLGGSDILVLTAGAPRRAGMQRKDLLRENLDVLDAICGELLPLCPGAKVLVVTNPVDILTSHLSRQWPGAAIFGLGCCLDAARFRYFLARAAGVAINSVSGTVIGTHDDHMLPLVRHATIGGLPAEAVLSLACLRGVVADTRQAGAEIVRRLKTRGSHYAASHCIAELVEAMARDLHEVFPVSVRCEGAYGYSDACLALPAKIGATGVEGIVEMPLDDAERAALDTCAAEVEASLELLAE